jgi:predicted DNA-binding transcriptional regulator YafY
MARFERLQELFGILCRTREPKSLDDLCEEMHASPATVKRLIAFLRDQRGVNIRYDRDQRGYLLERSPDDRNAAFLLGLSGREISALLEVEALLEQIPPGFVRDETQSVRSRLVRPPHQAFRNAQSTERIQLRMSQLRNTRADVFSIVLSALRSRKRLQFVYRSRSRDEEKSRSASPLRLTFYRSNWYLAAWCHACDELRVFAVDRISSPHCTTESGCDPPPDLIAAELDSGYGIFAGRADKIAVLRFNEFSARWVAEELWHPGVTSDPQKDGGVILRIPCKHEPELVMDILRHGQNVEVLEPVSLRKAVGQALNAAADKYRG